MARTAKITLGDVEYEIHPLNLAELQEVAPLLPEPGSKPRAGTMLQILAIALRRAEPTIEDVMTVEATIGQINAATEAIMSLAGFQQAAEAEAAKQDQAAA